MKIAVISDTHFSDRTDEIHRKIFQELMQKIALSPIDFLVFLGDFLDSQTCSPELFRFLIDCLEPVRKGAIPIYFVLGDHEMSNPFRATPLIYFSELQGCKVIESVSKVNLRHVSCLFLPSTTKDLNCLNSDHDAVFYHGFLQNIQVSKDYRIYRPSDFGIRDFLESGGKYYFFGGIHRRVTFDTRSHPEVGFAGYVGALFQKNFGEEGNPSGYLIWDSEKGVQAVDLESPRFKTIHLPGQLFEVLEALKALELPTGQWNLKIVLDSHFGSEDIQILRKAGKEKKELLSLHFEMKPAKKSIRARSSQISLENSSIAILEEWLKLKDVKEKKREIVLKRAADLRRNIVGEKKKGRSKE